MIASVTQCLSWNVVQSSHWSGPALWYGCIVFAICSILTGAQQTLILGPGEIPQSLARAQIPEVKLRLTSHTRGSGHPSAVALLCWQLPIMFLCYSILCFLTGLCSVVYSPLARNLRWNDDSKVSCSSKRLFEVVTDRTHGRLLCYSASWHSFRS